MFLDNSLSFNGGWTTPQGAITATADGTSIVDITGAGVGNAPAMINGFPATNTAIGEDWGAGDGVAIPYFAVFVTTTGTGTGTCTFTLKAAPDSGTYTEGTYYTLISSDAYVGTQLVKGVTLLYPVPPIPEGLLTGLALPRFYKDTYTISGTVGALKVLAGIIINPSNQLLMGRYNNNFTVI